MSGRLCLLRPVCEKVVLLVKPSPVGRKLFSSRVARRWMETGNVGVKQEVAEIGAKKSKADRMNELILNWQRWAAARTRKFVFTVSGLFIATIATGWLYYEHITDYLSKHGAEVATKTLGDERLKQQANQLSANVISDLLNQTETLEKAVTFLTNLANDARFKQVVSEFVSTTIRDEAIVKSTTDLVSDAVSRLLKQEAFREQVTELVLSVIHQESTKQAVTQLASDLLHDPQTLESVTQLLQKLGEEERTKHALHLVLNEAVGRILDDEKVKQHTLTFIDELLRDEQVKLQAASAIRTATINALSPWKSLPRSDSSTTIPATESRSEPPTSPSSFSDPFSASPSLGNASSSSHS